jgi:N-acyl-D-amino-acid deacylase
MTYDLLIKNGLVVDGSGKPGYAADIAIHGNKIVEIGKVTGDAKKTIDAKDKVVCPGFIDPHTHFDAQICWDPVLSPSSWYGVTTVILGSCGVTMAPCKPDRREVLLWDLTNVESIPMAVLESGVKWNWETFPEYMASVGGQELGINVGFLAGISPFRHYVMGEASMERAATTRERTRIAELLKEAVEAGAFGFSSSNVKSHVGYKGRPFASRLADKDEFRAYSRVLKELGKGVIEMALLKVPGKIAEDEYEMLDLLLTESGRKVTYTSVFARDDDPDGFKDTLRTIEPLVKRGAYPQATPKPLISDLNMTNPFLFSHFDCVHPLFNASREEQIRIYSDPQFRVELRDELSKPSVAHNNWNYYEVQEAQDPALKKYEGRSIASIAKELGKDPLDTFLDIAVQDKLHVRFLIVLLNGNDEKVAQIIGDPRVMIGLSDAGAHIDAMCDASYPMIMLGKWVRERKVLTLERAIQRMTSEPADFFGITSRGRLATGLAADIVVFNPETVSAPERASPIHDMPGGARRVVAEPKGIDFTIVNGQLLFEGRKDTGARAGTRLRSGLD